MMSFLNHPHFRIINRTSAMLRFELDLKNHILWWNHNYITVILLTDLLAIKKLSMLS